MNRIAYEKYNPNHTLDENAKKLGCSIAALKRHFKINGVDRKFDVAYVYWKKIQSFYKDYIKLSNEYKGLRKGDEIIKFTENRISYEILSK